MNNEPTPRTTLERRCDALASEWASDATRRRALSPADAVADALNYCASALREAVAEAADADAELTVVEYAALHHRPTSTVRRWCTSGAIRSRQQGREWLIPRSEPTPTFGVGSDADAERRSA